MKKIVVLTTVTLSSFFLKADPGNGIVKDSKGNIFYTDLSRVWKITPAGNKTVAVQGVHTHELYVDGDDNLFGEHLWYNGEQLNTWGSYAWRLSSKGKLDTLVSPKEGFMEDYTFNRDAAGNMYRLQRWKVKRIVRKGPNGVIKVMTEGNFNHISRLHVTEAGEVYFIANNNLYKMATSGILNTLIKNLGNKNEYDRIKNTPGSSLNNVWVHRDTIYISDYTGRTVKRWTPSGEFKVVAKSAVPWSPSGGLIDHQGNLWLMEYHLNNEVRVRKIEKNTSIRFAKQKHALSSSWMVIMSGCVLTAAAVGSMYIKRKKSG